MLQIANYTEYVLSAAENVIAPEWALSPALVGMRMFDPPIFAVADAADSMFAALRAEQAVGPQFRTPCQWLPSARRVISFFLPFSDGIKASNPPGDPEPSDAWLHGRIEGQRFLSSFSALLCDDLQRSGFEAAVPILCPEFQSEGFTSNWSERHVAYVCGLGTFGLSRGLITEKGTCGRFGSVVTSAVLPVTPRAYTELYEYCISCGACARNCPAGAIDPETGKDHAPCAAFQQITAQRHVPRFGCGKCQVAVPCMSCRPEKQS